MTSEHVSSFVTDLVEMAKAMERVPELEQMVTDRDNVINGLELRNTDLEVSLEASRRYAAGLEQKVHDLEVANTAIELRFLECDDAKGTLVRFLEGLIGDAKGVLAAVAPVPSTVNERIGEAVTVALDHGAGHVEVGESATNPTASSQPNTESPTIPEASSQTVEALHVSVQGDASTDGGTGEGISVPQDPSLATIPPAEASDASVDGNVTLGSAVPLPNGPYAGKRYDDHPFYVPLADWLAGGGTEVDYHWRPY